MAILIMYLDFPKYKYNHRKRFSKIQNIFTIWTSLAPKPQTLKFYNLGRKIHEHHNHAFFLSSIFCGSRNENLKDSIHFLYILGPP